MKRYNNKNKGNSRDWPSKPVSTWELVLYFFKQLTGSSIKNPYTQLTNNAPLVNTTLSILLELGVEKSVPIVHLWEANCA